eukprot:TRINITY_DN56601_c0_g1_i1.p1 TRINITY_DN56601_c0_g1~~TRINITY_DN56601_c0_g1_i1.p1  ORF type:complete len:707 (-),score=80.53 TRINITY_DN56601_c0_g1_i1:131-2251(-)
MQHVVLVSTLISAAFAAVPSLGFWPEYQGGRRVVLLDGQWDYGLHLGSGDTCTFVKHKIIGSGSYSIISVNSREHCCSKCTASSACRAFTYEAKEGKCYLKSNSELVETREGAESGVRTSGSSIDSMDPSLDPTKTELTPNATLVPKTMDAVAPGYMGPRGVAFYRRKFTQRRGPARLHFNACSFYCRVWVDGKEIGHHLAGGYVGFHLDVPRVEKDTERELVVLADNRFNKTTAPMHTGGDFWHYGGLMRSVLLHDMPEADQDPWPWRAYVLPTLDGYAQGFVNVTVVLTDPSFTGQLTLKVSFDEGSAVELKVTAASGKVAIPGLRVPSPRIWSTTDPQLHTITVLAEGGQGLTERFGLRSWGVDSTTARLTLNGQVLKLHGWNHHTQWPDTGGSPTNSQLDSDLTQMRAAGTNYIRGAHYPQDQRWLDRLDEHGIVMWEETLGPKVSLSNTQDPSWMKIQLKQLDEMMDMSMNHASIMTWGWFNEGPSEHEGACPAYKACSDRASERDPTRFRTWADNHLTGSKCLEHASLISFNNYPGWYNKPGDTTAPLKFWSSMAEAVRDQYPGKPFVMSETGAGGVYEWSDNKTDARWTQKYQVEIISGDVDVALSDDKISGVTLWHYFDFKGNDEATAKCGPCEYKAGVYPPVCSYIDVSCDRPGGENHKGVVDFWRRKKQAYDVVAAKYNAQLARDTASSSMDAVVV